MDPLTALGIAANVVQLVDFVSKLIEKSKEVYKSGQKGDGIESRAIQGPKLHHAHTTVGNRQNQDYSPQSQASKSSALKRSHNKQYAVRMDNIRRQAVMDDSGQVHNGLAESLGEENNVTIVNVAWLGKTDMLSWQAYGSIVVYVGSRDDVSQLLSCGKFRVDGRYGNTRAFEIRPTAIQCYYCQR
ncbi:hypothetical protein F5X98DRAFT_378726 [Xylaria grammica]|nr:hypothetical protein F5X98DRAFT_378726 [Xylaria grammica]